MNVSVITVDKWSSQFIKETCKEYKNDMFATFHRIYLKCFTILKNISITADV